MKKMIRLFSAILPLVLLHTNLIAQDDGDKKYEFVKTKTVNKSYNVSVSDKLDIENSFGKVEVHTWEKNEIRVDVSIEVSASREDLAQKIIDGISVKNEQSGREISFKTIIKGNNNSKGDKSTMRVNYSISMPASNPLQIANDFGATTIPDYRGEVDLTSKFGSLTTGNLSNVKKIQVEFGKGNFENIANGNIVVKYSKAGFGKLSGNIKMNVEFCGGIKLSLDNALTGLDLKASYSTLNLKPASDLSASYTIGTSFGSMKNRTAIKFDGDDDNNDGRSPVFDHKYTGRSGSGNVPVKVNSSFSTIILGEPGPDDMKEKSKSKSKTS